MGTGGGVGENQRYIFRPHIAAIGAVGAACAALDPANDFKLFVVVVGNYAGDIFVEVMFGEQTHFGKIARGALRGTGKDHVVHARAAQAFCAAFAHHPANSLQQVGFAATIGADDSGQPALNHQLRRFDEAFESSEFEPLKPHLFLARPRFLQAAFNLAPA